MPCHRRCSHLRLHTRHGRAGAHPYRSMTLPRPKFVAEQPIPPDTVIGVIGAGTMGAGIAEVAACGGHPVKIFDSIPEAVTRALEKVNRSLTKSVGKGRLNPSAAAEI